MSDVCRVVARIWRYIKLNVQIIEYNIEIVLSSVHTRWMPLPSWM